jgi:bifunctional non-homologous end joining protein LigD
VATVSNGLCQRFALIDTPPVASRSIAVFDDLLRGRTPQHIYAFDLLYLERRDLRGLGLLEPKRLRREILPPQPSPVLSVDHVAASGTGLFEVVCARDLQGVVAKVASGLYTLEATTWVKIKNGTYSQAEGGRISSIEGPYIRTATRRPLFGYCRSGEHTLR